MLLLISGAFYHLGLYIQIHEQTWSILLPIRGTEFMDFTIEA